MYDIVVSNVRLADRTGLWDVGIAEGKVSFVRPTGEPAPAKEQIRADGCVLFPGIIDAHVHTRDPGYTYKEDFSSAAMAAANGGVTTIMAMPNSNPPMTTAAAVYNARKRLEGQHLVHIYLVGGACSAVPDWVLPTVRAGAVAMDVYDDIFAYGTQSWIRMFLEAKKAGVPLCFYLMDLALERLRREEAAAVGTPEIEKIISATNGATEAMSIARIFPIAAYFDVPVVIRMVSTADAIEMVRRMREMYPQARVYVEVCVHYLFLTNDVLKAQGSLAHVHPPLRTQRDIDGLWSGISDGTVDYISSDHAPHSDYEKKDSLAASASGMVGLETMLPLLLDASSKGKLTLADIQRLCCENPAKIYGLSDRKGSIRIGGDADLTLVDMKEQWTVDRNDCYTRGAKTPFTGWRLQGRPYVTICSGKKVMEAGKVIGSNGE